MKSSTLLLMICLSALLAACNATPGDLTATPTLVVENPAVTQTATAPAADPTFTTTVVPLPIPTETFTQPPPSAAPQFIAYERVGQLLITDVTGGRQGGTTQYTVAGVNDEVTNISWSPSGEYVAFVSAAQGDPHVYYIFALGQSSPTDLGPGSAPNWSPDSKSVAYVRGKYPDDNIWVMAIDPTDNPGPRQLSFETNYTWGKPVFTPDGQSLIVAGTDRDNLGATGNTSFSLEYLSLDGSGTRSPLPAAALEGVRLPYDMEFSPDGSYLAFSTSYHLSACAAPGAYYVSNADGSNRQELLSPSLKPAIDAAQEYYHSGLSYGWSPFSDALVIIGNVLDCNFNSPTSGHSVAGPQMSVLSLDGGERLIIPGMFYGMSMDRSGLWIAASHYQDFQDTDPLLEIYSTQTGQRVLTVGPGEDAQLQP